jgi:AraC-like DNA-binding protein
MEKKRQFKRHVITAIVAIKEILDNNYWTDSDTTAKLAEQHGVSRNVLQAAFKQYYGVNIGDYKLQLRMEASRALLDLGKDSKEVSLELHYATQSGFTSAFKRFYGVTPTESINGHGQPLLPKKCKIARSSAEEKLS